jgi:SAM-dependent methyltransferase
LASAELVDYYRRRAAEYEAIYHKPERQADLSSLRKKIRAALAGRRVLEIACGTGYWTQLVLPVVATDLAEEPMAIAQSKAYSKAPRFVKADAYALPESLGRFDGALAVFWWSHIPRGRIPDFLASLHARLEPGACVVLMDNRFVAGSSTAISEIDADGNTYQLRKLGGNDVRVLKNFPTEDELRSHLPSNLEIELLEYYWLATYHL